MFNDKDEKIMMTIDIGSKSKIEQDLSGFHFNHYY